MEYVLSIFNLPRKFMARGWAGSIGYSLKSALLSAYWHLRDHFLPHHRNNYHPHILGHRTLGLFSALLISVKIFSIAVVSFGPVESVFSSAITSANIISLTNASRTSLNLSALKENSLLAQAAQNKANDMLEKGYFAHNTPDGKSPWDFIAASGYNYITAGENLAVNFNEAEDVESAWMNSPGHKANIVNKNFEEIGIGISQGQYQGKNAIFVVQMFGAAAAQKVALNDTPTTVAPPVQSLNTEAKIQEEPAVSEPAQSPVKAFSNTENKIPDIIETKPAAQTKVEAKELKITESSLVQEEGKLQLKAQIFGDPVKVLAKFGKAAFMLLPQADGSWFGEVELAKLSEQNTGLVLEAQDIKGAKVSAALASFSGNTPENFNIIPPAQNTNPAVSFFGKIFHPKNFEQQFYLIFIAVMLSCLTLAIAIKRHIQHLPLIANASFVIILAVGLWAR